MLKLSSRLNSIKPSATVAITQLARELKLQGKPIISLSVGEPDFKTPDVVAQAGISAIQDGDTKYTAVAGTLGLRQAIVDKLKRDNNIEYSVDNIIVSNGAKHSIYNVMLALLDDQDEVIIPAPYWVSYPDMTLLCGGKPVIVKTSIQTQYKLTPSLLESSMSDKTKLLILNSPGNPTGMVYSPDELKDLANILVQYPNIMILSDEIYDAIQWSVLDKDLENSSSSEPVLYNIANVEPSLKDRTIIINGVSKSHAMTGWRIGFAAAQKSLVKAMITIQSQMSTSACSISQNAAATAFNMPLSDLKPFVQTYYRRHELVLDGLNDIKGINCRAADGAFYLFANIEQALQNLSKKNPSINNDEQFCMQLLEQKNVACVPGSAFGMDKHIRISYAIDDESLKLALSNIKEFCQ